MNRTGISIPRFTLPLLLLLAFAGCNGDENNNDSIVPVQAAFDVPNATTSDPVVFFQKSATDVAGDDIVVVDVMLKSTGGTNFDGFTMEIHFDPGVVQVGQVDLTATPLGDCTSGAALHPVCLDNTNPSGAPPANDTGVLLIGVQAQSGGVLASVTGTEKLFTLRFVGATVGTSLIEFVDGAGSGDCEILDALVDLGIDCDSGGAVVTVAR